MATSAMHTTVLANWNELLNFGTSGLHTKATQRAETVDSFGFVNASDGFNGGACGNSDLDLSLLQYRIYKTQPRVYFI